MIYKYSLFLVLIFIIFYGSFWTFNHINAWLGIALFVVSLIFLVNQIFKKIQKNNA